MIEAADPIQAAALIEGRADDLAEAVTQLHFERMPQLTERYGAAGRHKCRQDTAYHLAYLVQALHAAAPDLFVDYVAWARTMLGARGIADGDLAAHLRTLAEVLQEQLGAAPGPTAAGYVRAGLAAMPAAEEPPADHTAQTPPTALGERYLQALLDGDRQAASRMVLDAVEAGLSVRRVYLDVFQRSQHEIGRLWQLNRISVAQEHYATAATQLIMSQLYPRIFATPRNGRTLVAACVAGDLHEIGVRMVSDFFEIEGWDTFYLGANVPHASVVSTLIDKHADVLALSATLTPHIGEVRALIRLVRANERCRDVHILVGGHPFNTTATLWRSVGADGYAPDAAAAIDAAHRLTMPRPT